ncbi:MAG: hypothetical protein HQL66_02770 [Magnetococcales bacterium]|nr:hypothetical protein [Magnetococcales bacterium]
MPAITLDDVPAAELTARVQREVARFKPTARLRVTVEEMEETGGDGASFHALCWEITRKARERGLTDDILAEILAEDG